MTNLSSSMSSTAHQHNTMPTNDSNKNTRRQQEQQRQIKIVADSNIKINSTKEYKEKNEPHETCNYHFVRNETVLLFYLPASLPGTQHCRRSCWTFPRLSLHLWVSVTSNNNDCHVTIFFIRSSFFPQEPIRSRRTI